MVHERTRPGAKNGVGRQSVAGGTVGPAALGALQPLDREQARRTAFRPAGLKAEQDVNHRAGQLGHWDALATHFRSTVTAPSFKED